MSFKVKCWLATLLLVLTCAGVLSQLLLDSPQDLRANANTALLDSHDSREGSDSHRRYTEGQASLSRESRTSHGSGMKALAADTKEEGTKVVISSNTKAVVYPTTNDQRLAFAAIVDSRAYELPGIVYANIAERYRKKLRKNLTTKEKSKAEDLLNAVLETEIHVRLQANSALSNYVLQAPDLSKPERRRGGPGKSGVITHGIDRNALFGLHAKAVEVRYFLRYDDYPDLVSARMHLKAAKTHLRPYMQ